MRTRHRVPSIFSLSMLDVFCCALGCVILLWLWNDRMAKERARAAGETRRLLVSTQQELADTRRQLASLESDLTAARSQAASLAADRDRVSGELAGARRTLDQKAVDLKNLRARADTTAAELARKSKEFEQYAADTAEVLAKKQKEQERLASSASAAQKRVLELETLIRDREERLALAMKRAADLDDQLHDTEGRLKSLKATADAVPSMRSDLDAKDKRLAAADSRIRDLERDLLDRKSALTTIQGKVEELQTEKRTLSDQVTKIKLAADNRFAGIQLTGRRVVLLVDTSGSMKLVDESTAAPDKWSAVVETAVKILKSLPDLEKFQVITFAEETGYPLGAAGEWIDYDANTSAERVRQRLAEITPKGNTNMYMAFDAAFLYRPRGMDTVYLLSDGLPNAGPGLSAADQARTMREAEREEILGKYVRSMVKQKWNRLEIGQPKVRINSVGFFYESPDVGAFLWALSRENDGSFVGMSKP